MNEERSEEWWDGHRTKRSLWYGRLERNVRVRLSNQVRWVGVSLGLRSTQDPLRWTRKKVGSWTRVDSHWFEKIWTEASQLSNSLSPSGNIACARPCATTMNARERREVNSPPVHRNVWRGESNPKKRCRCASKTYDNQCDEERQSFFWIYRRMEKYPQVELESLSRSWSRIRTHRQIRKEKRIHPSFYSCRANSKNRLPKMLGNFYSTLEPPNLRPIQQFSSKLQPEPSRHQWAPNYFEESPT